MLSTLEVDEARALLNSYVEGGTRELRRLRERVDEFDAAHADDTTLPFNRMVAEYGLISFQTLHDWALWAPDRIGPSAVSGKVRRVLDGPASRWTHGRKAQVQPGTSTFRPHAQRKPGSADNTTDLA
jgi:hypothetical protein